MLAWIQQYWGTVLITALIALAVTAIIVSRVRAKKQGKSTCSCGCGQCAMQGICHEKKK